MTQTSYTWAAPGRVNLIGEHVDYNDGLCLPFALPHVTTARVDRREGSEVEVRSAGRTETFAVDCAPDEVEGWAAYVAGVVWALRQEGLDVPGLAIEVSSDVPVGAGLSSSAALECAVAGAVVDASGAGELELITLATVARRAENDFVGVPTGPMDQLASVLGEAGAAVLIDCRDLSARTVPLDVQASGLELLVINTMADHELVGGEYAERRRQCDQARDLLGLASMRDATESDLERIDDPVIRRRAHHVVTEIARVEDVVDVLDAGRVSDIGGFLTASHLSLRDDFEVSCAELDVAVDEALAAGALGARMTGGGFGGCAIALTRRDDVAAVEDRVRAAYDKQGWAAPTIFAAEPSAGAHRL
jgi:galactokinase